MMSSNSRASGSSSGGTTTTASSKSSGTRLFVGNLAESVDEYTLIHFLSKHGKISKFDYLFHKAGPRKGRPRGYAFVEYATKEEALKTTMELNDKLLQGRRVSIKRANDAPEYTTSTSQGPGAWRNGSRDNAQRSTTLSILKGHNKPESRQSKISAIEAKLAALEAEKNQSSRGSSAGAEGSDNVGTTSAGKASLPDNFPKKPTADVIATGEKLEMAAEVQQQQQRQHSSTGGHRHGYAHGNSRAPVKQEKPKATLASLGASMAK